MKKFLLNAACCFLALSAGMQFAIGQTNISPTTWTGSGASATGISTFTTLPATTAPGGGAVVISQWYRGTGVGNAAGATEYNSKSWPSASGATLATAQASNSCVYFTITNNGSTELEITQISLSSTENAAGPTSVQMQYATSTSGDQNFGPSPISVTAGATTTLTFTPSSTIFLCAGQEDTFKLYAWGASSATGTLSINNSSAISAKFYASAIATTATYATGATPICAGDYLTLTGGSTGGPGPIVYSWTGPNSFTSSRNRPFPITPIDVVNSGTYIFTATDAFTCVSTSTVSVTVNPTPTVPVITPDPVGGITICSNDSVVLNTAIVAGLTYQWDTGNYATPFAIPGATSTSYTVHYQGRYRVTVTNSGGCKAEGTPPDSVRVKVAPTAVVTASGPLGFCSGGSVTLTSTTGAGNTYQWYNSGSPISGANTNVYTENASGNLSIQVTATDGCVVNSPVIVVTEVTTPTISASGPTAFCQGGSVLLSASITSGATGIGTQWINNGTDTLVGATTTSYVATGSGDYTCFVSVPSGCSVTTNDIPVTVYPTPNPPITFNGVSLSTTPTYATYQWFLNTVEIPGATSYSVYAYNNGSYRVLVSDSHGCTNLSGEDIINNLSVNNIGASSMFNIYPNPASDVLNIEAPKGTNAVISSMDGKQLMNFVCDKNINISTLPVGVYLISAFDSDGVRLLVQKFIKE